MEYIGTDKDNDRALYVLEVAVSDEIPKSFDINGRFSTILLVWDATDVADDTISRLARRIIDAGGVYFCTWGPDCERVHDLIDEEWVGDGFTPATDSTLMTTWHGDDSLADAIWFAMYNAVPIDEYFDECRSVIAVCIGCPKWAAEVRSAFADANRLGDQLTSPDQ